MELTNRTTITPEQADRIRAAAGDAGHTDASLARLINLLGYKSVDEVGPWHLSALLTFASDRALAGRCKGTASLPGETTHTASAPDSVSAASDDLGGYADALAIASPELLARWADRKIAALEECAALPAPRSDIRLGTTVQVGRELRLVMREQARRMALTDAVWPTLSSLSNALEANPAHLTPNALH